MLDPALIDDASLFLADRVRRTPLVESPQLSEHLGRPVFLKLECLQLTGSFKVRGALFALDRLGRASTGGVTTCSAGNHGLGVAWAAGKLGIQATIYVPSSVDGAKLDGMVRLGATVVKTPFAGFDDSEAWAIEQARASNQPWISAYDDPFVMAGNGGSLAVEILDQCPEVGTIVAPVGGGGMAGGIMSALATRKPAVRLVAAQLAASPALARSVELGHAVTSMPPADTIAGGLEGGLGRLPFEVLNGRVHRIALASEAGVWDGVRWMLRHHDLLIEPSAAVAVDACLAGGWTDEPGPAVVIISGRNVAAATVRRITEARSGTAG